MAKKPDVKKLKGIKEDLFRIPIKRDSSDEDLSQPYPYELEDSLASGDTSNVPQFVNAELE